MRDDLRQKIDDLLSGHRLMTIATLRPDGWPQATTVGYVNEGHTLYFICSPHSQKAANLARDSRVSLTIDSDIGDPLAIEGLSIAARAFPVANPGEVQRVARLMVSRYPEYAAMPQPDLSEVAAYRVEPEVISVLDYTKGFGHSDLVHLSRHESSA